MSTPPAKFAAPPCRASPIPTPTDPSAATIVASSKPTIYVRRILEKFELAPYFDVVEGSNLDGTRVDKKEVIAEVLSQLDNPSADDLLMIGDRKFDVIGAREMGFGCVGVRFGFAAPDELEQSAAVYIADTVRDLHRYLINI